MLELHFITSVQGVQVVGHETGSILIFTFVAFDDELELTEHGVGGKGSVGADDVGSFGTNSWS